MDSESNSSDSESNSSDSSYNHRPPFSRFNPEPGFNPEDYGSGSDTLSDLEEMRLNILESKRLDDLEDIRFSELREFIHYTLETKSVNNILMLERGNGWNDEDSLWCKFHKYSNTFENDTWVPGSAGNQDGPPCHICQKDIISHFIPVNQNNVTYWYCHDDNVTDKVDERYDKKVAKKFGLLQCVYCFNFFHRWKCSLSMNKKSYINKMFDRSWACATCVPVFISRAKNKARKVNKLEEKKKLLLEFLRKVFTELYNIGFNMNMNNFVSNDYIEMLVEKVDNVLELYDNG
jgi:hypothetical protein